MTPNNKGHYPASTRRLGVEPDAILEAVMDRRRGAG
jgi:hypothetical protein